MVNITLKKHWLKKAVVRTIACMVILAFMFTTILPSAYAQTLYLPTPGAMVPLSPAFAPVILKGVKIYPDNPLRFDFIIDTGDSDLKDAALKEESNKLIKYFLASLTVPENDLWVNLSPYEKDRIIPNEFGTTEMGRDLLSQDYILKQLTASLIYPENDLGKKFWERIYKKAREQYGTTEIPVNTFNKVWVVPEKASVYKNGTSAFVTQAYLKVMLEEDYLAVSHQPSAISPLKAESRKLRADTNQIIRDLIIPEIEKEVNEGENFIQLRQIYNSLILAIWFKRNLKESLLGKVYVGQNKVDGVDIEDKDVKQKIYDQYLAAYKKGVYNYIKEDYDPTTQETIPRKYFSGGAWLTQAETRFRQDGRRGEVTINHAMMVSAELKPGSKNFAMLSVQQEYKNFVASLGDKKSAKDIEREVSTLEIYIRILRNPLLSSPDKLENFDQLVQALINKINGHLFTLNFHVLFTPLTKITDRLFIVYSIGESQIMSSNEGAIPIYPVQRYTSAENSAVLDWVVGWYTPDGKYLMINQSGVDKNAKDIMEFSSGRVKYFNSAFKTFLTSDPERASKIHRQLLNRGRPSITLEEAKKMVVQETMFHIIEREERRRILAASGKVPQENNEGLEMQLASLRPFLEIPDPWYLIAHLMQNASGKLAMTMLGILAKTTNNTEIFNWLEMASKNEIDADSFKEHVKTMYAALQLLWKEEYGLEDHAMMAYVEHRLYTQPEQLPESVRKSWVDHRALIEVSDDTLGYKAFAGIHRDLTPSLQSKLKLITGFLAAHSNDDAAQLFKETWKKLWYGYWALGGMKIDNSYSSDEEAMQDTLWRSERMTYKAVLAGFPFGGGKIVVRINFDPKAEPAKLKTVQDDVIRKFNNLQRILTGQDQNFSMDDVLRVAKTVGKQTVFGTDDKAVSYGGERPSPKTAEGIVLGIQAGMDVLYGTSNSLQSRSAALVGASEVVQFIAKGLIAKKIDHIYWVAKESDQGALNKAFDAEIKDGRIVLVTSEQDLLNHKFDIYRPSPKNALLTTDEEIQKLKVQTGVSLIAGTPNHQDSLALKLHQNGVLYIPEDVLNAGGMLAVAAHLADYDLNEKVFQIYRTVHEVLEKARTAGISPLDMADRIAKEKLKEISEDVVDDRTAEAQAEINLFEAKGNTVTDDDIHQLIVSNLNYWQKELVRRSKMLSEAEDKLPNNIHQMHKRFINVLIAVYVDKIVRGGSLEPEELDTFKKITALDKTQQIIFGITAQNVAAELTRRIDLFQAVLPQLSEFIRKSEIADMTLAHLFIEEIPLAIRIYQRKSELRPNEAYLLGSTGNPAIGKTTRTKIKEIILNELLKNRGEQVVVLSIDDFHKSKAEREELKKNGYRYRATPGTHDVQGAVALIQQLRMTNEHSVVSIPVFDKAIDDYRASRTVQGKVGIILLEGWFIGANTEVNPDLVEAGYKREVALALQGYKPLFDQLDDLIVRRWQTLDVVRLMKREQFERDRARVEASGETWSGIAFDKMDDYFDYLFNETWDWKNTAPEPLTQNASFIIFTDQTRRMINIQLGGRIDHAMMTTDLRPEVEKLKDKAMMAETPADGINAANQNSKPITLFAFEDYHRRAQYVAKLKKMVHDADIVLLEEPGEEPANRIFSALATGEMTPIATIVDLMNRGVHPSPEQIALFEAIYNSQKQVYGSNRKNSGGDTAYAKAHAILKSLKNSVDNGDAIEVLNYYKEMIRQQTIGFVLHTKSLMQQTRTTREQNPEKNILVVRGHAHTPEFILQRALADNKETVVRTTLTRQSVESGYIFSFDEALPRKLALPQFDIKGKPLVTAIPVTDEEYRQGFVSLVLTSIRPEGTQLDYRALNGIASRFANQETFKKFIHALRIDPSRVPDIRLTEEARRCQAILTVGRIAPSQLAKALGYTTEQLAQIVNVHEELTAKDLKEMTLDQFPDRYPFVALVVDGYKEGQAVLRYQLLEEMDPEGTSVAYHRRREKSQLREIITRHRLSTVVATNRAGKTTLISDLINENPDIGFAVTGKVPGQSPESLLAYWGFSGQEIFVLDEFGIEHDQELLDYLFDNGVEHVVVIEGGNRSNRIKKKDFTEKLGIVADAILEMSPKPLNKGQIEEAFQMNLDGKFTNPFRIEKQHMATARQNLKNVIEASSDVPFMPGLMLEIFNQIARESESRIVSVEEWKSRIKVQLKGGASGGNIVSIDEISNQAMMTDSTVSEGSAIQESDIRSILPPWMKRDEPLSADFVKSVLNSSRIFSKRQLDIARKYNLLEKYETLIPEDERNAKSLTARLYYDTTQIMLYEDMLTESGKTPADIKTVLSIGVAHWNDNLALQLVFPEVVKGLGLDIVDHYVTEGRENIAKFAQVVSSNQTSPYQIINQDALRLDQKLPSPFSDTDALEKFDLIGLIHPAPEEWIRDGDGKDFARNLQKLFENLELRLSAEGRFVIVLDQTYWKYWSLGNPSRMLTQAGFVKKEINGTIYNQGDTSFMTEFWNKDETKDDVFVGDLESVKKVNQMFRNYHTIAEAFAWQDFFTFPLVFRRSNENSRNIMDIIMETLMLPDDIPGEIVTAMRSIYTQYGVGNASIDELGKLLSRRLGTGESRAMMGNSQTTIEKSEVGGIDLNPTDLNIQEQGNDIQINLPAVDLKTFENMNFTGFTPIIINIIPITNLPMLLGATPEEEPQEISLAR